MKQNWTYKKVKEVCDKASSTIILNKIENNSGDYALYGASGFVKGVDFYHRDKPYIGIVKDGAGVGRVNVYPAKSSLVGTMQYILPKENVLLHYLCYALQGLNLAKLVSGATIPHIYFKDYGEFPIPLPPLATQTRIVSELDLLQSIIDKQKAQLKEYDTLAQSIFYDMFGDPVENEKGWEVRKFGEICLLKAGKAIKASELSDNNAPFLYPCYGGNGIRGYINKYSHTESYPIVGRQGALCGNVNYAEAPFYATEHAVVVKPIKAIDTKWLFFQLKFMRLNQYAHGVAQPGLAVQDLEPLDCVLPPLSLQQSFAAKIESIEKQKAAISKSIAETEKLFEYTMDKYFG